MFALREEYFIDWHAPPSIFLSKGTQITEIIKLKITIGYSYVNDLH
jgi:hypothetical protein